MPSERYNGLWWKIWLLNAGACLCVFISAVREFDNNSHRWLAWPHLAIFTLTSSNHANSQDIRDCVRIGPIALKGAITQLS